MKFSLVILSFFISILCFAQNEKLISKGDKSLKKLRYFEALMYYNEAYSIAPSYDLESKIADVYYTVKDFRQAADYYLKLISSTKQKQEDYEKLYLAYHYSGNNIKAAEILGLLYDYYPPFRTSKFYWWATSELNAPCVPFYGRKKKLNYCVTLDAGSSIDPNNDKVRFEWYTGDGMSYEGPVLKHCFTKSGKHDIKLSSIDFTNNIERRKDTIIQDLFLSSSNFIISGKRQTHQKAYFSAYDLTDSEDYFYMVWETGDGHIYFQSEAEHIYKMRGEYLVKLTIFGKDESGYIYPVACLTKPWIVKT